MPPDAEVEAAPAPPLLPVLVVVPGGSTGLDAVLGALFSSCANSDEVATIRQIPKQIRANRVGRKFIGRDSVWISPPTSRLTRSSQGDDEEG